MAQHYPHRRWSPSKVTALSYGEFGIVAVRRLRHPHPTGMPDPAHKAGRSTRWIAEEMTLSRRTVTTIIDKRNGSDPTTTKHRERLRT